MPRVGRKPKEVKSFDAQIAELDQQIDTLKEKRKALIKAKEQEDIDAFLQAAKAAGKTPAELVAAITQGTIPTE